METSFERVLNNVDKDRGKLVYPKFEGVREETGQRLGTGMARM